MLIIKKNQVKELDRILLESFLKRVEQFISDQVIDKGVHEKALKVFIQEQYQASKIAGLGTEREIVQYILDKLAQYK